MESFEATLRPVRLRRAEVPQRNAMKFLWPDILWLLLAVPALVHAFG